MPEEKINGRKARVYVDADTIRALDEYTYDVERYVHRLSDNINILKELRDDTAMSMSEAVANGLPIPQEQIREFADISTRLSIVAEIHDDLETIANGLCYINWCELVPEE